MYSKIVFAFTLILVTLMTVYGQERTYTLPKGKSANDIYPNLIYFKLSDNNDNASRAQAPRLSEFTLPFPVISRRTFDISSPSRGKGNQQRSFAPSLLHKIELLPGDDPIERVNELLKFGNVAYAEPVFKEQLLLTPNDPEASPTTGSQTYLSVIDAYDAWDVNTGDQDIIIGISDTGLDLDHPDLVNKLHPNADGSFGYDFADEDNDAEADGSPHGTRVGGFAGAEANNGEGIAGIGFDAKLVPLKVFPTGGTFAINAYESIIAAADSGYHVINLSWGSENSYSQANQDIINYAVEVKDLVVVAAAGNTGEDEPFYPAAYDNVLSVTSTNLNDTKSTFSTYHFSVDVAAPGNLVYGTDNGGYGSFSGTSFSSPMAAGVAALVRSEFPDLNAQQVMERIRATADDIDNLNSASLSGKLGTGRLNAHEALTATNIQAVRARGVNIYGENDDQFYFGDSVFIDFTVTNYFDDFEEASITITDTSGYLDFPAVNNLNLSEMESASFVRYGGVISSTTPPESSIGWVLTMANSNHEDVQYFSIVTQPDEYEFENKKASLSLQGNGGLARSSPLQFTGDEFAREMGMIVSTGYDQVSDNAPTTFKVDGSTDFETEQLIKPLHNSIADHYAFNVLRDNDIGIKIEQSALAWKSVPKGMILSYRVINVSGASIPDLNVGLFVDWDIQDSSRNYSSWDGTNTSFVRDSGKESFAGVRVLTDQPILHSALDIQSFNGNSEEFAGAFADSLKHQYLAVSNLGEAGIEGDGNDVANIIGASIENLDDNEARVVTFLIGSSNSRSRLYEHLDELEELYGDFEASPPVSDIFYSCKNGMLEIAPRTGNRFRFFEDAQGTELISTGKSISFGPVTADSSVYVSNIDSTYDGAIQQIKINYLGQVANFAMSTDTLVFGEQSVVSFENLSLNPSSWSWDFGNGIQSTARHPSIVFNTTGTYPVTLTVTTQQGCTGSKTRLLYVLERPEALGIENIALCEGEDLLITNDTTTFRIYESQTDQLLFEGNNFTVPSLTEDTSFYIANVEAGLESERELLLVAVISDNLDYAITPELSNPMEDQILLTSGLINPETVTWVINGVSYEGDSVVLAATAEAMNIELSAVSSNGCALELTTLETLEPSRKPRVSLPEFICPEENLIIAPRRGTYFGFYDTPELDSAIYKGEAITLLPDQIPDTLWIVGLDTGLPGDTLQLHIRKGNSQLFISADPDTLYLEFGRTVTFSLNETFETITWYVDGVFQGVSPNTHISFADTGTYVIEAQILAEGGCSFSESLDYHVFEEEPIVLSTGEVEEIHIYPIPTNQVISISSPWTVQNWSVSDLTGKVLKNGTSRSRKLQIDLSDTKPGTYLLHLHNSEGIQISKRIVKL